MAVVCSVNDMHIIRMIAKPAFPNRVV